MGAPALKANTIETVAVFDDFLQSAALSDSIDDAFGQSSWASDSYEGARSAIFKDANPGSKIVLLAIDREDDNGLDRAETFVADVTSCGALCILVVADLSTAAVHRLLRAGAADFAPFPLPDGALAQAVNRARMLQQTQQKATGSGQRGVILPVYHTAGGAGATTVAVNLAWEIHSEVKKSGRSTALIDLDFQYGACATFLDLPRRQAVFELLSNPSVADVSGLNAAMTSYRGEMSVLTSPPDAVPLDLVESGEIEEMLTIAANIFDFVVVDLPVALLSFSDRLLEGAHTFFNVMQLDMRNAQNAARFLRAAESEGMAIERISHVLNRAPSMLDLSAKNRAKQFERSLGIEFEHRIPDGAETVEAACDQGAPLAILARRNPVRAALKKMAGAVIESSATRKVGASRLVE